MYWAMAAQAAAQFGQAIFSGQQAPEMAQSTPFNPFTVDNSGWAVNFGSGTATAAPNPVSTLAQGLANAGTAAASDPITLLLIAAVVVVVLKHK
jgi:hypothetical protein